MWLHQQLYGDWLSHARKYNERVLLGANPSLAVVIVTLALNSLLEMERFMNWWKGTIVFMNM